MFVQNEKGLFVIEGGFEFCEREDVIENVVEDFEINRIGYNTHDMLMSDDAEILMKLPERSTELSAGYDFFAPYGFTLYPGRSIVVNTGIKVKLPPFVSLDLYPRGGAGCKYKIRLRNTVGIVDSDYYNNEKNEGNILVQLSHEGTEGEPSWKVNRGDKFAQGIITPFFVFNGDNADVVRKGGFGHTDKNKKGTNHVER